MITGCSDGCDSFTGYTINEGILVLDKEGTISCELCEERGIKDKIIVLENKYCGACKTAVPKIKEAGEETGAEVIDLDLSEEANVNKMREFRVMPYYTPTMVVGCDVYIGGKSKEEYKKIFSEFLG